MAHRERPPLPPSTRVEEIPPARRAEVVIRTDAYGDPSPCLLPEEDHGTRPVVELAPPRTDPSRTMTPVVVGVVVESNVEKRKREA